MPLSNGAYVLNELKSALETYLQSGENRLLYLSQLPLTQEDIRLLQEVLGRGAVSIRLDSLEPVSWRETAIPGVWWGEYLDASGRVKLRTIEVGSIPQLAEAQPDDVAEGRSKLEKLLAQAVST